MALLIVCRLIVCTSLVPVSVNATQVFGRAIKKLRKKKMLSQEDLAEKAGLHRTYIGAVERGERNITLLNAQRIAKALGTTLADCLKGSDS